MDEILQLMTSAEAWAALVTLTVMEVVLGIDNLIFISVLTNKLPEEFREKARRIGIALALIMRLVLLGAITIIVGLTTPVFTLFDNPFSWRDLILIAGGVFLVWKATREIHERVEMAEGEHGPSLKVGATFTVAIAQIILLDLVFSIDSIITAVGMTQHLPIMFAAVIIAVALMFVASGPLARFINANPTIVMLALGFLLMIGVMLIADGWGAHVPKGYIYAAMAFSALVEALNMMSRRAQRRKKKP